MEKTLVFGRQRYDAARYRGYRITGTGTTATMHIFFDAPRDVVTVQGDEASAAAQAEIATQLDPENGDDAHLWKPIQ
jgi:hypothetical protein